MRSTGAMYTRIHVYAMKVTYIYKLNTCIVAIAIRLGLAQKRVDSESCIIYLFKI